MTAHEVHAFEARLRRDLAMERDAAVRECAQRGQLELHAAVAAAHGSGVEQARREIAEGTSVLAEEKAARAEARARQEERAAARLQTAQRSRRFRLEKKRALSECASVVEEARVALQALHGGIGAARAEQAAAVSVCVQALSSADAALAAASLEADEQSKRASQAERTLVESAAAYVPPDRPE